MIVKDILFGDNGRSKLIKGVNTIADAVGSTLGARGRTVLIESENHVGGITVTKDGVSVAKAINLMDPAENLAVMIMREASEKTATSAGDGTTTSMVLAQSIIHSAMGLIDEKDNLTHVLREIQDACNKVMTELDNMSTVITDQKLDAVATISANGDKEIGAIIADAYSKVGLSGVVSVEPSADAVTYSDIISGMKIDRGFTSKYFVTDHKKQEAILDKPYILVTDQPIGHVNDILPILEFIYEGGRNSSSLLIIGEIEENALNALNTNKIKSKLKVCSIIPPQFGYKRHQLMQDIATATGAKYFSEQTGDNLQMLSMDDLGRAEKVISGRFNTLVFGPGGDVEARTEELQEQLNVETSPHEKDFLKERVANLGGGVAVIYVGAQSDIEQKEKRDRVDDAVCAVRAALEQGILPGGGVALKDVALKMSTDSKGSQILSYAMLSPMAKILDNAGVNYTQVAKSLSGEGIGMDVSDMSVTDMMEAGIIDPTKVTKEALKNSVSVAITLLGTQTIITNVRES